MIADNRSMFLTVAIEFYCALQALSYDSAGEIWKHDKRHSANKVLNCRQADGYNFHLLFLQADQHSKNPTNSFPLGIFL